MDREKKMKGFGTGPGCRQVVGVCRRRRLKAVREALGCVWKPTDPRRKALLPPGP